jgi:hypothetical protein
MIRIVNTPRRATVPQNALGYAHTTGPGEGGILATVLMDRVIEISKVARVALGWLLGRVIVHEIGHLGTLQHGPAGLMGDQRGWAS